MDSPILGPDEIKSAFVSLCGLWIELHGRNPRPSEARYMFSYLRPDWDKEILDSLEDAFTLYVVNHHG
jgi:hypothetical protein